MLSNKDRFLGKFAMVTKRSVLKADAKDIYLLDQPKLSWWVYDEVLCLEHAIVNNPGICPG